MDQHLGPGFRFVVAVGFVLTVITPPPAPAATPDEVNAAVRKGVDYLYKTQNKDGSWEIVANPTTQGGHEVTGKQWGGMTAMATYALLAAGENEQDPRLQRAVKWLGKADIVGTYALGLKAQVWPLLERHGPYAKIIREGVKKDTHILVKSAFKAEGESQGWYWYYWDTYKNAPLGGGYDRSNSQYGVLGVWGCEQAGGEVPAKYWLTQDTIWKKAQNPDGGWEYTGDAKSTHTMSAAGLATLYITQDYLINTNTGRKECKGNVVNKNIDLGLGYMDKHAKVMLTNTAEAHYHYLMYGIERIGVASGRKYFGTLDWYQVGAETLVRQQDGDGAWGTDNPVYSPRKVPNTVFALMFLVRGRAPVVLNKLEYASAAKESGPAGWNQRPRDAANFAWWMGRQAERFYNWQIVNLKVDPDEFHEAPILYLAGSEPLGFKKEEIEKLKRYVEDGGMILGNADCEKGKFSDSFRKLGTTMFPAYEFRALPASHPIYTRQQFKAERWKSRPVVYELSNGVRSLMLLLPSGDPARKWQARGGKDDEAFQLGANLFYYATDKNLDKFKGMTHIVRARDSEAPAAATVKVARVRHVGNWDPEPAAWRRLGAILRNDHQVGVEVVNAPLDGKGLAASGAKLAHLTGTAKFTLDDAQRKALKEFVAAGGTLVVDAAGGSTDFADSAEKELGLTFGKAAGSGLSSSLPATHALFTRGGCELKDFRYRAFTKPKINGKLPRLKGIEVGGRTAVFFSREDLTAGMVGQSVDGIFGYAPETATAIMRKIVLHAGGVAAPEPLASADEELMDEEVDEADDGEMEDDGGDSPAKSGGGRKSNKPVEEITGDIDIQAELADKEADDRAAKRAHRAAKKQKVAEEE